MTSKERVLAVLNGQTPDRVPWGEHSIDYNIYEMFLGRESLNHAKFRETKAYWEGRNKDVALSYMRDTVELAEVLGMDLLTLSFLPPDTYRATPLEKINEMNYKDGAGNTYTVSSVTGDLIQNPINTAYFRYDIAREQLEKLVEDAKKLPPLSPDFHTSEYAAINYAVEKLGKTHFLIAPINGIEWPRFGATEEDSWVNLLLEPEMCSLIAEYQYIHTLRGLDRLAASGVDGVLSVGDLGNTTNLAASPDLYREIILPWHQKIYQECKKRGLYVLRHCCGHIWPIIDDIAENNDAYEGIQEYAGMDILKLKEKVGHKLTLWGGVLHEHIHGGTPDQVRADAKRAIEGAGKGGGLILGSSHSLTIGASKENVLAMKQALDDFGWY